MKLKLIEAAVLLGIVVFVLSCSDLNDCLGYFTEDHWYTCVNGHTSVEWHYDVLGNPEVLGTNPNGFPACPPSDNGFGGPLPSPFTMDTIPSPFPGIGGHAPVTASIRPRPREGAGSGSNAGGFIPVPELALPFSPVVPSTPAPASSTCDPSQPDVLLVSHLAGTLVRLGTCPPVVKATIPLVSRPLEVEVTPDGATAVVTNFDNAVSFVDLSTNIATNYMTSGNVNPSGLALSPDGKTAYVTSFNDTNPAVLVFNIASRTLANTIPLGMQWPHSLSITPDGAQLYVTYPFGNRVDVVDTLTGTVAGSLSIPAPYGIDFSPTGTRAYIASAGTNPGNLLVFDTATLQQVASYPVGSLPNDVHVAYGGVNVVVLSYADGSVSILNTASGTMKTTTGFFTNPMGLARVK